MRCESSFQWSVWISIFSIGLLQIYVIYTSLSRYVSLKTEIFDGYHQHFQAFKWVIYLLNFQIFVIIGALGAFPLWFYSVLFSVSSFCCSGCSPPFNRHGFHELIWKEAADLLSHQQNEKNNTVNQNNSPNCYCQRKIKIAMFHPISNLFQLFLAYILLLPVPFIDAWLIQIDHKNKEDISTSDMDFLVSTTMTVKIRWSLEYFNFLISLTFFALQFPYLIWTTNKLFSIAFSLLEFLIVFHILIDFPIISVAIKAFFKNCTDSANSSHETFAYSGLLLTSSVVGNILLLLTFFSIFQFAYEKCVQTLLKSSGFCNNFRLESTGSPSNTDQFPCQINTSSSLLYSSDQVRDIKTNLYSFICAALFFICGILVKGAVYYQYSEFRNESKLFFIFLIQSLTLVITYFMFWFGISLKPKWSFRVREIERKRIYRNIMIQKEESNYYKSLKTNFKNSQMSLSSTSNTNLSLHSVPNQGSHSRIDFTSPEPYMKKCSSLKLPMKNRDNPDFTDYFQLSQHLPQTRNYKTLNADVTSPKLFIEDRRENKFPSNSYYKCSNPYSAKKPTEKLRYEDPYQLYRKENSIQEETSNENLSSISDDVSSNITSSPNTELANKNNSNMKFVTFRLDNNAEISAEITSSSSNGSLTVISLEQSEAFLKELDGDNVDKMLHNRFRKDSISEYPNTFLLPLEPMASTNSQSFTSTINHTKVSLL